MTKIINILNNEKLIGASNLSLQSAIARLYKVDESKLGSIAA